MRTLPHNSARKPKKPPTYGRLWFVADLARVNGETWLYVKSGAQRHVVDVETLALLEDVRDPSARLWANIGDTLILFGPEFDEIASAEIVGVGSSGTRLRVRVAAGQLAETTRSVQLLRGLPARKIEAKTSRKKQTRRAA